MVPTNTDKASETPRTDALRTHGCKFYNHPRFDKKAIDLCETLERELYALEDKYAQRGLILDDLQYAFDCHKSHVQAVNDHATKLERENTELHQQIDRLTKELKIAQIKNQGSLANNLCPDHRDKQTGKPCLACEIERLTNERDAAHDEAIETAAQHMHDLSQVWGQDSPTAKDKYETYLHAAQRIRSLKRG